MRQLATIFGLSLAILCAPAAAQDYGTAVDDARYPAPGSALALPDDETSVAAPLYDSSDETQGFEQERLRRVEEQERLRSVFTEGRFADEDRATTGGRLVGP